LAEFGDRYCGYTNYEGLKSAIERLKKKADLPELTAYSFRHKAATVLRSARVPEDEIAWQLGHRRPHLRVTAAYGEWSPDYLKCSAAALDRWFLKLHASMKSRTSPAMVGLRTKKAA